MSPTRLSKRKMDPNERESNKTETSTHDEMEAEETSGFLDEENNSGAVLVKSKMNLTF